MPKENERVTVVEHPLVSHKLALLRDKNTPPSQFRQVVRELAMLETYESSRYLPTKSVTIETPLMATECQMLAISPVIVPILRAGLGMLEGVLDLLPSATVGHLGMERDHVTHIAHAYYAKMPVDIGERPVIVVDPMLATGGSAAEALLAADEEVKIITCAIDDCLNENAYILPGLGDAGDRIFGTLQ